MPSFKPTLLSIYGYGPVDSEVTLRGFGVSERTRSDSIGLFRFTSIYSFGFNQGFNFLFPELCIQSFDNLKRVTGPSCIPSLAIGRSVPLEIGPIYLSPTISITSSRFLTGLTTPNTNVYLHIFKNKKYKLPVINLKSNDRGEFEISLPTTDPANYKLFVTTNVDGNNSAKSNTLKFTVISPSESMLQFIINFLLRNKIMAFIFVEVIVFIFLFISALKSITRKYN